MLKAKKGFKANRRDVPRSAEEEFMSLSSASMSSSGTADRCGTLDPLHPLYPCSLFDPLRYSPPSALRNPPGPGSGSERPALIAAKTVAWTLGRSVVSNGAAKSAAMRKC